MCITEELLKTILKEFKKLINNKNIEIISNYLTQGNEHKPSKLPDNCQGVYIFFNDNYCFKVGKAGQKNKARWSSHHYTYNKKTRSSLTRSILKNKQYFSTFFEESKRDEINNLNRFEIIINSNDKFILNLLEALFQYRLKPIFEGKIPNKKKNS